MKTSKIYLAAGCFWGVQRFFDLVRGVESTEVGYSNGFTPSPSYISVKSGGTGYAETVKVIYDKSVISLTEIIELYFKIIDPVSLNRQGDDIGEQYRTGIFYTNDSDLTEIKPVFERVRLEYSEPLAVQVLPLENFYTAEEYHQKYLEKNPEGYCHITPAMLKLARDYLPKGGRV